METISPIKITAIINPFSGLSNKAGIEQKISQVFQQPEYNLTIAKTEEAGHATVLSKNAVNANQDIVIAIGGDGTMNEVASGLIGSHVKMGIISMGSGNGFARHLGLHLSVTKSLELVKIGHSVVIDSCTVNNIPFVNIAGIGFDAKVAYTTKLNKKRGLWPYVKESIKGAINAIPVGAICCINDRCFIGDYKTMVIANASLYGFKFSIAPLASLQDGNLDIMLYKEDKLWKYLLDLPKFITGKLHKSKLVDHYKSEEFKITLKEPNYLHLDGEGRKIDAGDYLFRVLPNSLKVIVDPNNCSNL